MDKQLRTTTSVREVRDDLDILWSRALAAGAPKPPPSRVTFSREGWLDFLNDPEIRQCFWGSSIEHSVATFLGAAVVIDKDQGVRFKTELTGNGEQNGPT